MTRSETGGFVVVTVTDAKAGQPVTVPLDLSGPSPTSPAVSLSEATVESPTDRDRVEVAVSRPAASPDGIPPIERGVALAYVDVSSTPESDPPVETAVRYELDPGALPEGLGPDDVRVLRYTEDDWTVDGAGTDSATTDRTATLPRPTWFAIVALEPGSVEVTDAVVEGDWVRADHETSVRVTVGNAGDRPATRRLSVAVAGEQVADREATVPPGESATVRIPFRPARSGPVTVDGVDAGRIEVSTASDRAVPESEGTSPTADDAPGFGTFVAIVALLATALVARPRRE